MTLMQSLRSFFATGSEKRYIPGVWPEDMVSFNGVQYPLTGLTQTIHGKTEEIPNTFVGLAQGAYSGNGIVFACMLARVLLFSEARFQWQPFLRGRPGDLYGTADLEVLERPWPGGVTADLLTKMLTDADLAGTAFVYRPSRDRLVRMRPDWVTIVLGKEGDDDVQAGDLDAEILGYIYHPGGRYSGRDAVPLLRQQVAQFQYATDPTASFRGMSWLAPILREIQGDNAATTHKLLFFENGATPNMVVKMDQAVQRQAFEDWVALFKKAEPTGWQAYKTLYLGGGADATVVGANLRQMDFKITQGAGETRIAAAARIPPIIVGLSEGLAAATYSNYGQARRAFADGTMRPLWRNAAGSLETIIPPPPGSRLWYDDRDIPFLREDKADLATIQGNEAQTIRTLVDGGYVPDSVVRAVEAQDWTLLRHTELFSVQLQPPGTVAAPTPPELPAPPARALLGPGGVRCPNPACGKLVARSLGPGSDIDCPRCKTTMTVADERPVPPPQVTFAQGAIQVLNADAVEMDSAKFAGAVASELRDVFDQPMVREVERDVDGRPVRVTERRVRP